MNWGPYLAARAAQAFPGILLLRAVKDRDGSVYLDKTAIWADFMAYRGFVWAFSGGVTQNPYRAGYGLGRNKEELLVITRRTLGRPVSNHSDAVRVVDDCYPELSTWLGTINVRPVDGLPFELHAIDDLTARRAAGKAYTAASLD